MLTSPPPSALLNGSIVRQEKDTNYSKYVKVMYLLRDAPYGIVATNAPSPSLTPTQYRTFVA